MFIVILQKEKWGEKIETLVVFYIFNINFFWEYFSFFCQMVLTELTNSKKQLQEPKKRDALNKHKAASVFMFSQLLQIHRGRRYLNP